MTVLQVMAELESFGNEGIKKILLKHGVREPLFGVKVEHMKTIQKKIKKDYQLAKDLYATGNNDAQYLAGLIADDMQMTTADLQTWVQQSVSENINGYTVPWVAAEGKYGFELALEWINSDKDYIAAAGWSTLGNIMALKPDTELDIPKLRELIGRVVKDIQSEKDRVRYTMNSFIISAGSYVMELTDEAIAAAKKMGPVTVIKEGTACKTPDAAEYIEKTLKRTAGKKKKTVKC